MHCIFNFHVKTFFFFFPTMIQALQPAVFSGLFFRSLLKLLQCLTSKELSWRHANFAAWPEIKSYSEASQESEHFQQEESIYSRVWEFKLWGCVAFRMALLSQTVEIKCRGGVSFLNMRFKYRICIKGSSVIIWNLFQLKSTSISNFNRNTFWESAK